MVIQLLTFVALTLAKIWAREETQHSACDNPLDDICDDGTMGLISKHMKLHDVHNKSYGQGD
jgi:hypothetical protein